tara:strand:+ start:1170 stop:1523 length:354 start_codon:yes stop_codon:yes gene_type:complete
MEMPEQVRDSVILMLDEYLETENDQPDAVNLAEQVIAAIEAAAEGAGMEDPEEVVARIEDEQSYEDSLIEALEVEFENTDDMELTGEEIMAYVERVCGIEWLSDSDLDPFGENNYDE